METLKRYGEIKEPDHRSTGFGVKSLSDGATRSMILADFYRDAESIRINENVREDVRSYMAAVKTLFVYGWFYYPFYTLAAFMATTAAEMALRARLPKKGNDSRGLGKLFNEALRAGLLGDENFPSREHIRENRVLLFGEEPEPANAPSHEPEKPYAQRVSHLLTHFRNVFAHPTDHWIMVPGQAFNFLILSGEVINGLWPDTASEPEGAP